MTTATGRTTSRFCGALVSLIVAGALVAPATAMQLDDAGDMRLGLRAYTNVRIGTEKQGSWNPGESLSWPVSGFGHIRQHRYFLQLKFDHDLKRISQQYGWAWLLGGWMKPDDFSYSLQYRGEGEGIYDYGPSEFSRQGHDMDRFEIDQPNAPALGLSNKLDPRYVEQRVSKLRRISRMRNRFFAGYLDFTKGPVQLRIGRQVLAWGETDIFRLLDNINPTDASFGGFLLALDERRVPIDMIRGSYRFDSIGPFSDSFLEGFIATGNTIAQWPGTPGGAEWSPGGIGRPNPAIKQSIDIPPFLDFRGGARLVFNAWDATFSLAHYYTYLDIPGTIYHVPRPTDAHLTPGFVNPIIATARFPRTPISGATVTFPIASWYSVFRSEAAYIYGEPMSRQGRGDGADSTAAAGTAAYRRLVGFNNTEGGVDPFVYPGFLNVLGANRRGAIQGSMLKRDTFNMSVGLDVNRFIRWINPAQTVFFSTQMFYKHIFDSPGDVVLPVPIKNIPVSVQSLPKGSSGDNLQLGLVLRGCGTSDPLQFKGRKCLLRPRLYHVNDNQFLHTLLITTSYFGGQLVPSFGMFYDWQGAFVAQPGFTLVRDPFRFVFDYSRIWGSPTGQLGTLNDRDNIRLQVEFVF